MSRHAFTTDDVTLASQSTHAGNASVRRAGRGV